MGHGGVENKSRFNLSWGTDTSIAGRARTIGREKRAREREMLADSAMRRTWKRSRRYEK